MAKIIIIDGYNFIFRAYHSMPPLTRPKDGLVIGALYGFCNMMFQMRLETNADYFVIVLDHGSKTFRNKLYPEYKANRPPAPDDLIPQFPLVREAIKAMNIVQLEQEGFEADDIIATLTKQAGKENIQSVIVSSDKDLMQLIDDKVSLYDPTKKRVIDKEAVKEKFGVYPNKMLDLLAMAGDSADNIPGIKKVGPKTATKLLEEFGTLENILENAENITANKLRENVINNKENAILSKKLITLSDDVEIKTNLEDLKIQQIDQEKLNDFFTEQGFSNLTNRLSRATKITHKHEHKPEAQDDSIAKPEEKRATTVKHHILTSEAEVKELAKQLNQLERFAIYYDFSDINSYIISITISENITYSIKFSAKEENDLFAKEQLLDTKFIYQTLSPIIFDSSINKITYDIKSFLHQFINLIPHAKSNLFAKEEYAIASFTDIRMLNYILNNGRAALDLEKIIPVDAELDQLAKNSEISLRIFEQAVELEKQLIADSIYNIYKNIDHALTPILFSMEQAGFKISQEILANCSKQYQQELTILEQEIYKIAGEEFNIASPKQMAEILYDKLSIEYSGKKSKTGNKSTSQDLLEDIAAQGHEIATKILRWRHLSKLKGTYSDALPKQIDKISNRVHSNFSDSLTSTGRLSSTNPNLQNIPIRSQDGDMIRKAFICEDGNVLISADYSQIELRLLAHIAGVESLIKGFEQDLDIHKITASEVFGVPIDQIDDNLRRQAKTINFGIIYGISAFGLANRLNIPRSDAKEYIESYFTKYPQIQQYMLETVERCKELGYVETLHGRKLYFPNIQNPRLKSFAERAVINAPLQGTAADIIKIAMINIEKKISAMNLQARLILQVHDELIYEVQKENAQQMQEIIKDGMEKVISLKVPLKIAMNTGRNWLEIH
jgi:DNA polymerase I